MERSNLSESYLLGEFFAIFAVFTNHKNLKNNHILNLDDFF